MLIVDKPGGITSRDAVDRAQRWFPRGTRLGHTGTLDPLATGVLALCAGAATRLTEYVQRMGKTYRSTFRLGARSDTDDADGTITPCEGAAIPDRARVEAELAAFVGAIEQTPPAYSAAKVSGRRAYDLARRGDEVDLRPRQVHVYGIDVLACDYPLLEVEVRCGKGTYIRSLARDLGERLGCGGLVEVLRRTRVGPYSVDDAVSLDADAGTARSRLLPMATALAELPSVTLSAPATQRLRQGQTVPLPPGVSLPGAEAAVFDPAGGLVAVAVVDPSRGLLRPVRVLSL